MPIELEYEYLWIDTRQQIISIYHDSILVEQYSYHLPSSAIELSKTDL